ncbi:DUF4177 domain-containing protein [Thioclava sp. GXIMD4216]|uniref:DUF4177 domain-containing protein n=1 Tax=Thioclava litoralis TaxID=3076557 RepID=A0ABZ1E2B6_9RHOB|nr:DUF4177 domain-containing protein [Thioclava sp. FTW29]
MQEYEYKVIPAPVRGERDRGLKTAEDRFANTLTATLNAMAVDGWHYLRAETLPAEERSGLRSKTTTYHNLLVFRRPKSALAPRPVAEDHPAPVPKAPLRAEPAATYAAPAPAPAPSAPAPTAPARAANATLPKAEAGPATPQPPRIPSAIEKRARSLSANGPEGKSPKLGGAASESDDGTGRS